MEEQRIGMMYVNLVKSRMARMWDALFGRGLRRSPLLPWLLLLVVLLPVFGWYLHTKGKFATMKREIKGEQQGTPVIVPRPGGAEAILLTRAETPGNSMPEFLSATVLPGLGMGLLQITASIPGRGEVPLLAAPSVQQIADGTAGDRSGVNDLNGALELPWAGSLPGILSPIGTSLTTSWHGRAIEVPLVPGAHAVAEGGLLSTETADATQSIVTDGVVTSGTFRATDFGGRWPAKTDVSVSVQVAAHTVNLTVSAKNVGDQPEPMGIGWHPRFVLRPDGRQSMELRLPAGDVLQLSEGARALPTGKIEPAGAEISRLQGHAASLGAAPIDASLVHLKPGLMDSNVAAELRDPASGFGIRLTAVSAGIRELRVSSPANARYLSLGLQTNLDDPLGREWAGEDGPGIASLQPGQTMEWKVRLEIFPISKHGPATAE